ncbi:hypothetical protein [Micromonospora sp. IBHARD004]|uniref:hypothetical protein n=1 Tax=Micromonospora sp. IBHARD004 TaxID=3457764 RepID=UPI004059FAFC
MTSSPLPTAAPHPPAARPAGGGLPARRAVVRWAVRLLRRELRQQLLVIGLLTVAVAAATFGVSATWNLPASSDATFGRADQLIRLPGDDPGASTPGSPPRGPGSARWT